MSKPTASIPFTAYQKFAIFILAITQFTVILDFMVMSPLGDILMKSLDLKPSDFGFVVSAYAFSAGISGLLTAGFADKFDRKKLLLFFYMGLLQEPFSAESLPPILGYWLLESLPVCLVVLLAPYQWPLLPIYLVCNNVVELWDSSKWHLEQAKF